MERAAPNAKQASLERAWDEASVQNMRLQG